MAVHDSDLQHMAVHGHTGEQRSGGWQYRGSTRQDVIVLVAHGSACQHRDSTFMAAHAST